MEINPNLIKEVVCNHYDVRPEDLESKCRKQEFCTPRHTAVAMSRKYTKLSWRLIGESFGGRDHVTLIKSCRKHEDYMVTDPGYRTKANEIEYKLSIIFNQSNN